ncbi:hypothetical protein D3C83_291010 [compost metagenome]
MRKPSFNGAADVASTAAPGAIELLTKSVPKASTVSVTIPRMLPRGMSRAGSMVSSAASGSSSIAR